MLLDLPYFSLEFRDQIKYVQVHFQKNVSLLYRSACLSKKFIMISWVVIATIVCVMF